MEQLPEWARYLLAIAGVLIALALSWIITALTNIGKTQTEQTTNQKLMGQEVRTMSAKIENLDKWRNGEFKADLKDTVELMLLRKEKEDNA